MYVPFDTMPENARVWIFQSSGFMPFEKVERLSARLMQFLDQWHAHGQGLQASFHIMYHRFVIVALDEAAYHASGCSIDKLNHTVMALEKELAINLMDRSLVSFRDDSNLIITLPMATFRQMLDSGELDEQTVVFNNLISTKKELRASWEVPLHRSWHRQWLPIA